MNHGPSSSSPTIKELFECVPLDKAPARLGFEEDSNGASVDQESVWESIVRDPQLPVIEKKEVNKRKDVRDVFLTVVNGSFSGEYSLSVHGESKTPQQLFMLGIAVFYPRRPAADNNREQNNVLGSVCFRALPCPGDENMQYMEATEFQFSDTMYDNVLTDDEKSLLKTRVLHYFIRQKASQLEYYLVRNLVTFLNSEYLKSRSYQEILDAWLILGDVAIASSQVVQEIHQNLIRTAESLEGLRFFLDAAELYEEAIMKYSTEKSAEELCNVHHYAGLAFKRAEKYDDAERHLVLGWHYLCEGSEKVTVKTQGFNSIFITLCSFYSRRAGAEQEQRSGTTEHRRLHQMVVSLLITAGFRALQDGEPNKMLLNALNQDGGLLCRKMLPRSIRNKPTEALKLLVRAGRHSTAAGFRKTLLLAQDRRNLGFLAHYPGIEVQGRISAAKSMRQHMRGHFNGGGTTRVNREMCHHCKTLAQVNVTLMQCPCRAVRYCNSTCQKEHWTEHKQYCTWHKEKKKNSKEQKKTMPK